MSDALSQDFRQKLRDRLRAEGFNHKTYDEPEIATETTDRRIAGRLIANAQAAGMLTWAFPIPNDEAVVARLRSAMMRVVMHRPNLRTAVAMTETGLNRTVLPAETIFSAVEFSHVSDIAATPIDPAHQPPLRVQFLPGFMVISTHHVAADERTWELLLADLNTELANPDSLSDHTVLAYDAPEALVAAAAKRRTASLTQAIPEISSRLDPFAAERILSADPTAYREVLTVSQQWVAQLHSRAGSAQTTPLPVLMQAAARIISRRSHSDDTTPLVVGTPADIREALGADAANTDGDRVSVVAAAIPPRANLSEVAAIVSTAVTDRCAGLEDIIPSLGLSYETGRSPLIDVVVTHRYGTRELIIDGKSSHGKFIHSQASAFDAVLSFEEDTKHPQLSIEYRSAALHPKTAALLLAEWRDAILLDDADSHSQQSATPPSVSTQHIDICKAVAQFAHTTPDALAVRDASTSLTYKQLHQAAVRLAAEYTRRGAQAGEVVALELCRSVSIPVAMLAALYSATPFVCIDPAHPPQRTQLIIKAAQPSIIITDADVQAIINHDISTPIPAIPPVHSSTLPAYLVFTSGTTGTPKGVVISRESLANVLFSMHQELEITPTDTYLAASTLGFDIAIVENLVALAAGASVYIAPADFSIDIKAACALLKDVQPTIVEATPSLWLEIVRHDPRSVQGIRACAGGEELSHKLAVQLRAAGAQVVNLYGPSETAIVATAHRFNQGDQAPPLGLPLPTVGAEVLDPLLRPTPIGALGELYLSGPQLAYGYLDDPAKTAVTFIAAPDGQRRYRTGDMVVKDSKEQLLHYHGRFDQQLSLHGIRIERAEIEAALAQTPGVVAAAIRVGSTGSPTSIIAYVLPETQTSDHVSETAVMATATELLPAVARPSQVIMVTEFPRTATGKIDRDHLPTTPHTAAAPSTVETYQERIVVSAVQELLELDAAPSSDLSFHALGGHSLVAHRLALTLSAAFGVKIPVRTVLSEPTLATLAAACATIQQTGAAAEATSSASDTDHHVDIQPINKHTPLPGQQRIMVAEQYDQQAGLYTIPLFSTVNGEIDSARLTLALRRVLAAHPVLRSRLSIDTSGTFRVTSRSSGEYESRDLAIIELTTTADQLPIFLDNLVRSPFTALDDAPLRSYLITVADDNDDNTVILAFLFHHAFFDEWSLKPFFADLQLAYDSETALKPRQPDFAELQAITQFRDPKDKAFWAARQNLTEDAGNPLPFSRAALGAAGMSSDIATGRGSDIHRFIEVPATADTASTIKAAVLLLLARAGCNPVFGMPVSGRHDPALLDTIGYFGNTLPVYVAESTQSHIQVSDFIQTVAQEVRDVVDSSSIPLEELQNAADFQVLIDYRNGVPPVARTHDWNTTFLPFVPPVAKFPLTIAHTELSATGPHRVDVLFSGQYFEHSGAAAFMMALEQTIASITKAHNTAAVLGSISIGTPTPTVVSKQSAAAGISVPEFLDQQFAAHHDDIMLSCHDRQFTGGELQQYIRNTAATLIQALDNEPAGKLVAIHHRSRCDEVLSMLSIMAAGAAFTVLRPDDPIDRLTSVLSDSQAQLILADSNDEFPAGFPPVITHPTSYNDSNWSWPQLNHPAYMVFTSGTTGRPKGVLVDHRALSGLLDFTFELLNSAGADENAQQSHFQPRLVSIAPMSFDVGILEVVSTLCAGGHLYIAAEAERFGPPLVTAVSRHRATHFAATPTVLSLLGAPQVLSEDVTIFSGAEPLPVDLAQRWAARHKVINLYGPTEATVNAIHGFVTTDRSYSSTPIGTADPQVTAVILDDALQPAAEGMVGELWLAGPKLALGYPALPERTAITFVAAPNHLGLTPGARMYRTGDLAVQHADGNITCLGRVDDQMKIRGLRIEPAEIESALRTFSSITDARVVHITASMTGTRDVLAAAIVASGDEQLSANHRHEIRQGLTALLPRHLIPQQLVQLPGLPVTANGKADRATTTLLVAEALTKEEAGSQLSSEPTPIEQLPVEQTEENAAASSSFTVVAEEVAELLRVSVSELDPNDDFLQLGGDSILALQLAARLKDRGLAAGAQEIFAARTLGELAASLSPAATEPTETPHDSTIDEIGTFTPVRAAAEHIATAPDSVFAQSMLLDIPDFLSGHTATLVTALVQRHSALRTRITDTGECETLATGTAYHMATIDIDTNIASDMLSELRQKLASELDVRTGIMVAAAEIITAGSPRLLVVIHHIAVDAASWLQIMNDLELISSHYLPDTNSFADMPAAVGMSIREGSQQLAQSASDATALPELRSRITTEAISPMDTAATAEYDSEVVSAPLSTALLERFGTGNDLRSILVTALAQAARTVDPFGPTTVTIDVEDHGRSGVIDPRSIGWWTEISTVIVDGKNNHEWLTAQLPVPYQQRSDILLNHLGGMFQHGIPSGHFAPSAVLGVAAMDVVVADDVPMRNPLTITSEITDTGQLKLTFIRASRLLSAALVAQLHQALLAELQRLVGLADTPSDTAMTLPVTPTQEGIFYLWEQGDPSSAAYLTRMTFQLKGHLDPAAVIAAWARVGTRHPVLQSRFHRDSKGEVIATVDATAPLDAQWDDDYTEAEITQPFDLTHAPLTRLRIKRLDLETHVIDVVFHHILADGWSAPLLINDFFTLLDSDHPLEIIDPRPALVATRGTQKFMPQWRKALRDAASTYIATGGSDHGSRTELRFSIDSDTTSALQAAARENHLTIAALLHGAWAEVLRDLTKQSQVCFGSVVAGRPLEVSAAHKAVGLFATTIPVAVPTTGDRYRTARHAANILQLAAEQPPSLAQLQRLAEKIPETRELFDSLLVMENYPLDQAELFQQRRGLTVADLTFHDGTHYPVMVVAHSGEELSLRIAVADGVELINGTNIEQLAANLERQLRLFAGNSLLADRIHGLAMTGPTPVIDQQESVIQPTIHQWTATDSHKLIQTIASHLQHNNIGPGDHVALALPRGIEQVCATYAIWLTGAATMPIEVAADGQTTQRARAIIDAAHPALVVDTNWLSHLLNDDHQVTIKEKQAILAARPRRLTLSDPAYVIHTSGTTGTPKGIVAPWSLMEKLINWQQSVHIIPPSATIAHYAPDQFDVAIQELLTAQAGTHPLVIVAEPQRTNMPQLARLLDREGVDVLFATNTVLNALAREYQSSFMPSVSVLIQAGEALQPSPELCAWCAASSGPQLYNQYGPSETHVVTATADLAHDLAASPTLGKPLPHVSVMLLADNQEPVATGEVGELYVSGALATGYLNDPHLTAEKFPIITGTNTRYHRTGDLVAQRPDGTLEYRGRADDQIKIKGVRISPSEITAIALLLPGISEAVALENNGVLSLIAVSTVGHSVSAAQLREHFHDRIGDSSSPLIPERILFVPELPLTSNGKTDFRTLSAWLRHDKSPQSQPTTTNSTSTMVELIATIMADVLQEQTGELVHVQDNDDFLALGGHSLSGTRLTGRLSAALGREVSLRTVLEQRTPSNIAAALVSDPRSSTNIGEFAAHYRDNQPRPNTLIPATPAQQRFWALAQLDPNDTTYNLPLLVKLRPTSGSADIQQTVAVLTLGLRYLVRRHEALRTVLQGSTVGPQQLVLDAEEAAQRLNVTVTSDYQELQRLHKKPFRLDSELPIRAALCAADSQDRTERNGQEIVLSLVLHHAACDGWSLPILMADLANVWQGIELPQSEYHSPAAITAAHHQLWQDSGQYEKDLQYWDNQLADLPCPMQLPLDRPRNLASTNSGALMGIELTDADMAALYTTAQALNATPFMIFHAAVASVLSRLGCGDDIVLGTPVSGRHGEVDESAVGCFVNLLVLRTSLAGNPRFTEIVDRIRQTNLEAAEHAALPFELVARKHAANGSKSHHPLFTVGIGIQNLPAAFPAPEGYSSQVIPDNPEVSRFDLNFDLFLGTEDLSPQLVTEFDAALFDTRTITLIVQRIKRILHTGATAADTPLHSLPVLLDDERALLRQQRLTPEVPSKEITELLRGITTIGHVLTEDGDWLTATELQTRVDALAKLLITHGAHLGDVIGIACQRSVGQLVAQLAVLRVGAAYVPILPDTPVLRLEEYIKQCAITLMLSTDSSDLPSIAGVQVLSIGISGTAVSQTTSAILPAADTIPSNTPAYVLFTSGSTGTPKGVLVSRANVEAMLASTATPVPLGQSDTLLALSPFCFDVTGWEYLAPLAAGARLIIADDSQHRDPQAIAQLIEDHAVTCCEATPGLWSLIAEATNNNLEGVRAIISGEELPAAVATAVRNTGATVWNLYGPTEATVFATAGQQEDEYIDIGSALGSVQIRVLDDFLTPVPTGGVGDLYLVGPQIAYGYLGRSDLTASAFVADPEGTGNIMYRTGDVVRLKHDGRLLYLGRRDQQIQLRGHRVELGEVVSSLLELPQVTEAAAKVLTRHTARTLVGFFVAKEPVDTTAAVQQLRQKLADYLVPAQLVQLAELPRTINGKVDVANLPDPEPEKWLAPETDTEKLLATIVAELLGMVDSVPGRNQSFISLGGDSITAIRLAARSAENGLPLTVQDVLSAATIAELGAIADSRPQAEETTAETNGEESSDLSGLSSDDLSKVITAFGDNRE